MANNTNSKLFSLDWDAVSDKLLALHDKLKEIEIELVHNSASITSEELPDADSDYFDTLQVLDDDVRKLLSDITSMRYELIEFDKFISSEHRPLPSIEKHV